MIVTHRAADLRIVNKIGSKLYKPSLPAVNARITQSILVLWEGSGDRHTGTARFWLAVIGADGKIWSAVKLVLK